MAVTIDTTTNQSATAGGRQLDRCSNGILWAVLSASFGGNFEFHYSDDDGTTWTHDAGANLSAGGASGANISFFIDEDDYAHVCFFNASNFVYHRGTPNAERTAWTWSSALTVNPGTADIDGEIIAFPFGTGWVAFIVWAIAGADAAALSRVNISAAGVPSLSSTTTFNSQGRTPRIDFRHTGNGKTPHGTPNLYLACQTASQGIAFVKVSYSLGLWTIGSTRTIDANGIGPSLAFDGARVLFAYRGGSGGFATTEVKVRERDEADTETRLLSPPALPGGGTSNFAAVTYDANGNVYLFAGENTGLDVEYSKYDRAAGTWSGWAVTEFTTFAGGVASPKRGASDGSAGSSIEVLYTTGTGSPYNVRYARPYILNEPPTTPTWVTTGGAYDVAASLLLDWTHNDPDGDAQGAFRVKRVVGATTTYWNGSTWVGTETDNVSATESLTLASAWGVDSDANHSYYVATRDATDWGPYSSALTVTPSAKVNPTIDEPDTSDVITTATITVDWTVSQQSAYRVRILSNADAELYSTGWVVDTATRTLAVPYVHANSTTFKAEVTTKNTEGLESDPDTNTYSTSFTAGPTPTLAATANTPTGAITWDITNAAPGGGQPALAYNDLYRRVVGDTGDGIRIAANQADDANVVDYAVASGTAYEARVAAWFDNGTVAYSAWTS